MNLKNLLFITYFFTLNSVSYAFLIKPNFFIDKSKTLKTLKEDLNLPDMSYFKKLSVLNVDNEQVSLLERLSNYNEIPQDTTIQELISAINTENFLDIEDPEPKIKEKLQRKKHFDYAL